jgi:hypothetical protein
MSSCPECGGCENTGTQPCPTCQPQASDRVMPECEICAGMDDHECGNCDGSGEIDWGQPCYSCGGTGMVTPEHCCLCGGSPYCTCCRTCGQCVGTCRCPVTVRLGGGGTLTLGGAS